MSFLHEILGGDAVRTTYSIPNILGTVLSFALQKKHEGYATATIIPPAVVRKKTELTEFIHPFIVKCMNKKLFIHS